MSRFDVKSFCTAPDPELVCGICMNVLDEPKETPCRHVFCNACITRALETKKGCPMCRTRVTIPDLRPVLPLVNNLLNKLPMTCKNYRGEKISASCKTIIKKEFYLDHLKKCEFEYVDCPHQGCKDMVIRREQTEHQESCLYRTVECPKCDTQYTYKDRRSHCCVTAMKKRMQDLEETNRTLIAIVREIELENCVHDPMTGAFTALGVPRERWIQREETFRAWLRYRSQRGDLSWIPESAIHTWETHPLNTTRNVSNAPDPDESRRQIALGLFGFGSGANIQPAQNNVQPARNTVQPAPNNVQTPRNHVHSAQNNVQPAPNTAQPAQNHVQQAQNNVQPPRNTVQPAPNNVQPLRNTVQPAPNNVQPAQNTVQPAPNNVHPPRNIVQPARNHVQQAQNNVQPAGHHVQSSRNNFQPAGHYVRHDIYHNYGPPVLDLSEDDLYANYASEYAQTNSNATTEQVQQGAEWPPSPIINISSDHQEEEESDDELEDDVPELVDFDPNDRQYHEQYDSYREDVTEHNWTDDASTTSRSSSVNGAPDRGGNRSDEADVDVENVYTSSNGHNAGRSGGENRYAGHAGWPVQAHSSTTNHENYQNAALANRRAAVGNPCGLYGYGFESIHAAHRAQYEASTPGVDLTQASFSGFGQRRHREYIVGQSDEAGWNKRPRTDGNGSAFRRVSRSIGPGADTVASENRHLHPPPAHRQLPAPILPPREPMIFPQQVSNSSEGSRRTSARLLGIDPPPSTIRNVAVPPSTGELLDRLASGEEEDSDDPSWDSGSDDSN